MCESGGGAEEGSGGSEGGSIKSENGGEEEYGEEIPLEAQPDGSAFQHADVKGVG
jgi:hypothetical protein